MKLILAVALLAIVGCNNPDKKGNVSMAGAYKMLSQSAKSDKIDTVYTNNQMKIFTDDYMMYANINSPDSISGFGVGSYSVNMDTATENVIYASDDSTSDDTLRHFTLLIEKTGKGYKQVIPEIGSGDQKFKLAEDYESVGTATKTPIDGAWKLVSASWIKETDTTESKRTQFKMYNAGYCIWGNTWTDSLNKKHTGIGFGKFEMNGTNKVKESMSASTYAEVRGHDFDIDVEMNGADGFTQTMNNPDGSKSVEVYQRLKK